jgi:putative DNA primase/helicase
MTTATPPTISFEVYQAERDRRIKAEQERDYWKNEFYLQRQIRRAPVLQPIAKSILEECRHVEKWGKVKGPDGSTRANYTTIAKHLHTSPDTVARQAERMEKLGVIKILEFQGPQDERDRKYIHVNEEQVSIIARLSDPEQVVPKQGGDRYQCQNPNCLSHNVAIRTVKTLQCLDCGHETIINDTGWKVQNAHNIQKQPAFETSPTEERAEDAKATCFSESVDDEPGEKQNAEHGTYTLVYDVQSAFEELKALKIWCPHRAKVPYQTRGRDPQKAMPNKPETWSTYEVALATYQEYLGYKHPFDGIGFMNSGAYTLLDIDTCREKETGKISEQARAMVMRFQTYWEISQSGTGLHGIARGSIPAGVKEEGVIEMYPANRFFVWTGNHLDGTTDTIEDCDQELHALYSELRPAKSEEQTAQPTIDDAELDDQALQAILEKVRNGKNGLRFTKLWNGDASDYRKADGSPDYSRADAALCNDLAYWTDNNVSAIDRLFRQSGLMRPKWDRKARSGEVYGEGTITRALVRRKEQAA